MYLSTHGDGIILNIWLQPRAARTKIVGIYGDNIKISVKAPPLEGRANDECIEFLSALLGFPKKLFTVKSGEKSRRKRIYIKDATPGMVEAALERAVSS
ncbi:MAG: YggU family protein [Actinobacteria bacterium]|nr:YggU family protein [Actinomycetota bacterium]